MIIIDLSNSNPQPAIDSYSIKSTFNIYKKQRSSEVYQLDFCNCRCENDYIEKVFWSSDSDNWKSDKSHLPLWNLVDSSSTVVLELWKNGAKIDDIDDSTYGDYYNGFTNYPYYFGFVIDWNKVNTAHGNGYYLVKGVITILGDVSNFESQKFYLQEYSDKKANGTVRVETYNTGTIINSNVSYLNLIDGGWYQSFRFTGQLMPKQPKLVIDKYLNQDYINTQIQDIVENEWELQITMIPSYISNQLIYDNILANEIIINDYNVLNEEIYRNIELYCIDIPDKKPFLKSGKTSFLLKFADRQENNIKNNY